MNKNIEYIKDSKSIELMIRANALKEAGVDIVSLAGGEPDFPTPELIKNEAIQQIKNNHTHYSVGKGILSLRKAISKKLKEENDIVLSEDEIIVTPGAKMAIYLAVATCISPGDEVLIPTPAWVSYTEIVKSVGGIPVEVNLNPKDNYSLKKQLLEEKTTSKTRMIIICSPNNPTGRVLSEEEVSQIIEYAENKNIIILSDEIYEKIVFDGRKNISLASKEQLKDKTLTINGFSKSFAMTGWRLGYISGPLKLIDSIYRLFAHTITGTPTFIQEAAVVAFNCAEEVSNMTVEFEKRRNYFVNQLKAISKIHILNPEGTFYAWAKIDIDNPSDFLLNRANVVCVPGEAYGSEFKGFVRFSFSVGMEQLEKASSRIKESLNE